MVQKPNSNISIVRISDEIEKINRNDWLDFVIKNPHGNIFHTPKMYDVYLNTKKYYPLGFFAFKGNRLVGVLIVLIQKELPGMAGYFTARAIIRGGPVIDRNESGVLKTLLESYNKAIKHKVVYSEFRNMNYSEDFKDVFGQLGYKFEDHLDIHINLDRKYQELMKDVKKGRKRNLKKSINKGTEFYELNSKNEIKEAYSLIKETYQRIKKPFPDLSHFLALYNFLSPHDNIKFFVVKDSEDNMIGFRTILCFKNLMYDYYAGSSRKASNKYPNDVCVLKTLEWGCNSNYTLFDFGGAGKPNEEYKVRDFKLTFGGELKNFGRFIKIHSKPIYYTADLFLSFFGQLFHFEIL